MSFLNHVLETNFRLLPEVKAFKCVGQIVRYIATKTELIAIFVKKYTPVSAPHPLKPIASKNMQSQYSVLSHFFMSFC